MKLKETLARFGIASKGFVYILIGGLTTLTVLGLGGTKAGSTDAFEYIASNILGKVLLSITALGLFIYMLWACIVAIKDPEDIGRDAKGLSTRFSYLTGALFYGMLGFSAIKLVVFPWNNSDDSKLFEPLLNSSLGVIFLYIFSVSFIVKACYQVHLVTSGIYKKKIKTSDIESEQQKNILIKAGIAGFSSRAIVFGVIAYLAFRAAMSSNTSDVNNTTDAFQFLENTFGTIILAIIAIGTLAYGVFVLLKAKYRIIDLD